jgi:imidazole glycerol phosphate synthase subunit HisF
MKIGLKRTECDVVRWIYVAENRGKGELVTAVMTLGFHKMWVFCLTS